MKKKVVEVLASLKNFYTRMNKYLMSNPKLRRKLIYSIKTSADMLTTPNDDSEILTFPFNYSSILLV